MIISNLLVYLVFLPIVTLSENVTFKNVSVKVVTTKLLNRVHCDKKIENIVNLTSSNYLKDVLQDVGFNNFREVRVENQTVPCIYENAFNDLYLMVLSIKNCTTTTIQKNAFANVSRLDEFTMQNTNLEVISTGVFTNVPVVTLNLANNKIGVIELSAFTGLSNIQSIVLCGNRLFKEFKIFMSDLFMD